MPLVDQLSSKQDSVAAASRCEVPCIHCGLPTACLSSDDPREIFCCNGCRQAYQLIHQWGLDDYYAIRDRVGGVSDTPGVPDLTGFECFDEPQYLGSSTPKPLDDGSLQTELSVSGLHCAACAWLIENVAARTAGWRLARVKLNRHTLQIVFDPDTIRLSEIARLVGRLGYALTPLVSEPIDRFRDENRRLLIQIAVAGFCAANAMLDLRSHFMPERRPE